MARIKYYYDTETCKYERIRVSSWDIFLNGLGIFSLSTIIAIVILAISSTYFESPQVSMLKKDNQELLMYYEDMHDELENMNQMLGSLQERDDNIYRVIFEADPIPTTIRQAGVGGTDRWKALREEKLEREDLLINTLGEIDKLKKQMYIQTKSYDDIIEMAKNKSAMLASIPSIQPIPNKDLKETGLWLWYEDAPYIEGEKNACRMRLFSTPGHTYFCYR